MQPTLSRYCAATPHDCRNGRDMDRGLAQQTTERPSNPNVREI